MVVCDSCGSTHVVQDSSGFFVCKDCGTQMQALDEVAEFDPLLATRMTRRVPSQATQEAAAAGDAAAAAPAVPLAKLEDRDPRPHLLALQRLLSRQLQVLITELGCAETVRHAGLWLWMHYLRRSAGTDQDFFGMYCQGMRWDAAADAVGDGLDVDGDDGLYTTTSFASDTDSRPAHPPVPDTPDRPSDRNVVRSGGSGGEEPVGKRPRVGKKRPSRPPDYDALPGPEVTLVLCYLATVWVGEGVALEWLLQLVRNGRLPYLDAGTVASDRELLTVERRVPAEDVPAAPPMPSLGGPARPPRAMSSAAVSTGTATAASMSAYTPRVAHAEFDETQTSLLSLTPVTPLGYAPPLETTSTVTPSQAFSQSFFDAALSQPQIQHEPHLESQSQSPSLDLGMGQDAMDVDATAAGGDGGVPPVMRRTRFMDPPSQSFGAGAGVSAGISASQPIRPSSFDGHADGLMMHSQPLALQPPRTNTGSSRPKSRSHVVKRPHLAIAPQLRRPVRLIPSAKTLRFHTWRFVRHVKVLYRLPPLHIPRLAWRLAGQLGLPQDVVHDSVATLVRGVDAQQVLSRLGSAHQRSAAEAQAASFIITFRKKTVSGTAIRDDEELERRRARARARRERDSDDEEEEAAEATKEESEEIDADVGDDDDEEDRRRAKLRARIAAKRAQQQAEGEDAEGAPGDGELHADTEATDLTGAEVEEEEEEEESEYETDSDESGYRQGAPMIKPVFVTKAERATIAEREAQEAEAKRQKEAADRRANERRIQSKSMVMKGRQEEEEAAKVAALTKSIGAAVVRSEETGEIVVIGKGMEGLDGEDEDEATQEAEYKKWKLRELLRIKRDREERNKWQTEMAEIERRRQLTDAERAEEDRQYRLAHPDAPKQKYTFLQKYYHKGAYFMDKDEDDEQTVLDRSYDAPTLEDKFDKTVLPSVMQVKNFGRKGRTKWTHLTNEDTSQLDANPWNSAISGYHSARTARTSGIVPGKDQMGGLGDDSFSSSKRKRKR